MIVNNADLRYVWVELIDVDVVHSQCQGQRTYLSRDAVSAGECSWLWL